LVLLVEPTLFCSLQALVVASWSGAKAWLHVQDFEVDAAFDLGHVSASRVRNWALAVERKLLRRFDRVSAISDRMVERLILKGVDPSRCVLFPNWVDPKVVYPLSGPSPLRQELGIDDSRIVALYSGSMGKKQGLELLADAARRHASCKDLLYVFSGEGSYRQTLIEKTKDLPNVVHLPLQPSERLNDLLNLADIHLLPQRANAADLVMPSKLTGMLASGRPVVATAHPGTQLAKTVQDCGVVVAPGDLEAFTSAILALSADGDLLSHLGQEARKHALAHLHLDRILLRFEEAALAACARFEGEPKVERPNGVVAEARTPESRPPIVAKESSFGAGTH
jgi:colanic acid biosynthesis glycosyl transferase WcaI